MKYSKDVEKKKHYMTKQNIPQRKMHTHIKVTFTIKKFQAANVYFNG